HSKNVLIHQNQPKIADFGLSKQINERSRTSSTSLHGMPQYIEPNCFRDPNYKRNMKSDVYSFGIILCEISSGRHPFQTAESTMAICFHIYQGNREEPVEGTPPQYIELYKRCWDNDPANRPEIKEILNTLIHLIRNETLSQQNSVEVSTQNSETSSSHQDDTSTFVDSYSFTTSTLCLSDTINVGIETQYGSILEVIRKEANECFTQGKFLKALE
ncbi:7385_t:CDS:1, partial [Ambispora leptoticha]